MYPQSGVCVCVKYICPYKHIGDSVLDLGKTSIFNLEISFYAFVDSIETARKWLPIYSIKNRKEQTIV